MDCKVRKYPFAHLEEPHLEEAKVPLSPMFGSPKEERLWGYLVTQEQPIKVLTHAYAHSLSQLPIFHYLPLTTKINPRICPINDKTSTTPSLEDLLVESLQTIKTPWEEILKDPLSKGNPWLALGNTKKEHPGGTLNQNIPNHNMASVPPLGGNQRPLPPPGRNQPPPPFGSTPSLACIGCCSTTWETTWPTQECKKSITQIRP